LHVLSDFVNLRISPPFLGNDKGFVQAAVKQLGGEQASVPFMKEFGDFLSVGL